ncbi:hypothetical protein ACFLUO_08350 [Chloroflexota bacterium]
MSTYQLIEKQQQAWAKERGIKLDNRGYTFNLKDNLFIPLSPRSEEEFGSGRGDELGNENTRGKMQALHSSSALVVNVFEYWRGRNVDFIAQACGAFKGATSLHFERTFPTGLVGIPPHLDVGFYNPLSRPLVIEGKFTEPYHRKTKRTITDKYLNISLWKGLAGCENLVQLIRKEELSKTSFSFLDVPQLLKHILGLTKRHGKRGFELIYLWYDYPSLEAEKHRLELRDFEKNISYEVIFRNMTYQDLFKRIRGSKVASTDYIDYLADRYFYNV